MDPILTQHAAPMIPGVIFPSDGSTGWLAMPGMGVQGAIQEEMDRVRRKLSPVRAYRPDQHPPVAPQAAGESARKSTAEEGRPAKPKPPAWVENSYRPRWLTHAGLYALERLGPTGDGLRGYLRRPLESMEVHRDILAARYVALDLVQRGLVFEARGSYHHIDYSPNQQGCAFESRLALQRSDNAMTPTQVLLWLAYTRIMMLDQFIMVDPLNARNNVETLLELEAKGLALERRVVMGCSTVAVWQLSKKGWRQISNEFRGLESRGFGPMRPLNRHEDTIITSCSTGMYALHQLLQGDAILWFKHDLATRNGYIEDLFLARALAAEGGNERGGQISDFRIHAASPDGRRASFDVEVVGKGHPYRTTAAKTAREKCVAIRCFSGESGRPNIDIHVTIGR